MARVFNRERAMYWLEKEWERANISCNILRMNGLYWFRSDLRCSDNYGFAEAVRASDSVLAVFILTPKTFKTHAVAPLKLRVLLDNLHVLSECLWKQGIPLLIREVPRFAEVPSLLKQLCRQHKIDTLYFNREYALDELNRDQKVEAALSDTASCRIFDDQLVLAPGTVLNKQGKPFKVFTPFKRTWLQIAHKRQVWLTGPRPRKLFKGSIKPDLVPQTITGFDLPDSTSLTIKAGEQAACLALNAFCQHKLTRYAADRDYPAASGTSILSPYLAQGVLSARQCIAAALEHSSTHDLVCLTEKSGVATWISELIWREFYQHIVYFFKDVCRYKPFRPETDRLPWSSDKRLFEAWTLGQTGFPIVDAGMRQLNQTGWMHNRLRMVTAMFLTKLMRIDWRMGERYFMEHLIDGDFASNNGGWQWCASTGTDAAPYFRIFNPTTQGQKFDPEGTFIRQFCPELAHLDNKTIQAPYASGIEFNHLNYPKPVVDYVAMRRETIKLFKAL